MVSRLQALWGWFDSRMPSVAEQWKIHASEYYAPKNFNFWYFFGSLALLVAPNDIGRSVDVLARQLGRVHGVWRVSHESALEQAA